MKTLFLKIITIYQKLFSPVLHYFGMNKGCRFYPSCSNYTHQAIKKYGLLKGVFMGFKRIIKCHPFGKGGYDPC